MHIGEVARISQVNAKMIRHYESIGLVARVSRNDAGYRQYSNHDVQTLRFIKRSRDLGFPLEKIRTLLTLWRDRERQSADVKQLAQQYIQELDTDILKMQSIRDQLVVLSDCCKGDDRPGCPILDDLSASPDPDQSR